MKTKIIRIKARSHFEADLLASARRIDRGRRTESIRGEYFESIDAVRIVLTPKRLELWRTIRDRKPRSISQLAKFVRRNFKSVYQDVQLLVAVGLVELRASKAETGKHLEPRALADSLRLEVA